MSKRKRKREPDQTERVQKMRPTILHLAWMFLVPVMVAGATGTVLSNGQAAIPKPAPDPLGRDAGGKVGRPAMLWTPDDAAARYDSWQWTGPRPDNYRHTPYYPNPHVPPGLR